MQIESNIGHARELVRQNDADQQRAHHVQHGPQDQRERQDAVSASGKSDDDHGHLARDGSGQKQGHRVDIRV